jgi:GT2 family glycosyltransferase
VVSAAAAPFSVLIPERGRPDLLVGTLAALERARSGLTIAHRVRVLVNGAPARDYRELMQRHADVHWQFTPRALGFHGAIERLIAAVDEPWVYLLNSDMRLVPDALRTILPWRASDVFAIASQIEFADSTRRREETGYTLPVRGPDGQLELHDRLPVDAAVRAHVYAGGGASLFQTAALRRFLARSSAYAPFYFEDADWGMQAWAEGLSVLFCPDSRAIHEHRATIGRYVPAATIERIVRRNLEHFRWRYGDLFGAPRWHGGRLDRLRALARGLRSEHRRARQQVLTSAVVGQLHGLHLQRYPHAARWRPGCARVLLVSPFAVLPPAHGGARRIVELARASAASVDWILLHDEAGSEPLPAQADDSCFREIHPIGGRPDAADDVESRWNAHAHPTLLGALRRLIATRQPDLVIFEHVECIGLIEQLDPAMRCVWTLHDAGRLLPPTAQARVRAALLRVATLVLTTEQDRGYWQHRAEVVIENGTRLPPLAPPSAADGSDLLLVAPLRYQPNLDGLREFLEHAWPTLRARHPWLRLRVLAGDCAAAIWGPRPLPAGVDLVEGAVDPAPHYASTLLALNPQGVVEGSALKVAEALAHGRVMVSTASGARGYEALTGDALVRAEDVAAMAAAIAELIADPARRRAAEATAAAAIAPWSWAPRAAQLVALIDALRHGPREIPGRR